MTAGTLDLLQAQRQKLEQERRKLEEMDFTLSGMIHNLRLGTLPDMLPKTAWFKEEHLLALPAEELTFLTIHLHRLALSMGLAEEEQ